MLLHFLQVFGLLVWMLIAGTDYSSVPALGWVMFIAVVCWLLTVFFFIMYLTSAYSRIPLVPWRTVVCRRFPWEKKNPQSPTKVPLR